MAVTQARAGKGDRHGPAKGGAGQLRGGRPATVSF